MYEYTPCAIVRNHPKNRTNQLFAIVENDLQNGEVSAYPCFTSAKHWQLQKFWDFYTHPRRQTRHDAAGFFMPVSYATGGLCRVCVDYKTANGGKKRVVTLGSDRSTRQLLPNSKTYQGENLMNATQTGNRAQNPFQALVRLLPIDKPSHTVPRIRRKRTRNQTTRLVYKSRTTGLIAYLAGDPVAWIVPGYHSSRTTGKDCKFVDVSYHRQTSYGVNLETRDFDNLQQAFDFLATVFPANTNGKGGAV